MEPMGKGEYRGGKQSGHRGRSRPGGRAQSKVGRLARKDLESHWG